MSTEAPPQPYRHRVMRAVQAASTILAAFGRQPRGARPLRLAVVVALLSLALVPAASAADAPSIQVISPAPGATITTTDIEVQVATSGIDTACQWVGTPDQEGQGNIHVFLDQPSLGTLINVYCGTDSFTISGQGITPGTHTLIVDLASNTHGDMLDTAQMVEFTYQPATPAALPEPQAAAGTPAVHILSPADGATVGSQMVLELAWDNFTPSCDLEGKPAVAGYGHLHVVVDAEKATSPLAGLVAMPCDTTVPLDLSAWGPGTHTIMVGLAQNDHTPVPDAEHAAISVTVDAAAAPLLPQTGQPRSDSAGLSLFVPVALALLGAGLVTGGVLRRRSGRA